MLTEDASAGAPERMPTKFLGRIAHDLRGPAGVSLGALDEIERALGPEAEPLRPLLQMAHRGLRRILRAADRLDRTSSLEERLGPWEAPPCDLKAAIRQSVKETQLIEGRDRVSVEFVPDDALCVANVDIPWFRAALAELISNAIRFAKTRVVIEARQMGGEAWVVILDDGPGFSGPVAPRYAKTKTQRGLGLSLPLVLDVVLAHGGRVDFRNRRGDDPTQTGTAVTVVLPRREPKPRGDP